MASLDSIFRARSLALVGASSDQRKLGYMTLDSIIKGGYEGRIYPVNPKYDTLHDLKCYRSLEEIEELYNDAVSRGMEGTIITNKRSI